MTARRRGVTCCSPPTSSRSRGCVLLTHGRVVGIEASEALLVGEVGPESQPHVGARGQDDLLARCLLGVRRLPAAEGCQLLVLRFDL